jgi:pyrroloquinoline-quinone synthase
MPERDQRRRWIQRILDHDGAQGSEGGIEAWLRLGEAVGLARDEVARSSTCFPACALPSTHTSTFARPGARGLEAVCASLTEALRARDPQGCGLAGWPQHYSWIDASASAYFAARLAGGAPRRRARARGSSWSISHRGEQERALEILQFKLDSFGACSMRCRSHMASGGPTMCALRAEYVDFD